MHIDGHCTWYFKIWLDVHDTWLDSIILIHFTTSTSRRAFETVEVKEDWLSIKRELWLPEGFTSRWIWGTSVIVSTIVIKLELDRRYPRPISPSSLDISMMLSADSKSSETDRVFVYGFYFFIDNLYMASSASQDKNICPQFLPRF